MHVISTVSFMTCNLCQSELLCEELLAFELLVLLLPKKVLSITERVKADKHCIMTGVYTEVRFPNFLFLTFSMFLLYQIRRPLGLVFVIYFWWLGELLLLYI